MKSNLVRKKIGNKIFAETSSIGGLKKILSLTDYITQGENLIIVRGVESCNLTLDYTNTNSIKIKAFTQVVIIPKDSTIDEFYEELVIEKGACVELEFLEGSWYILSSDGLKLQ